MQLIEVEAAILIIEEIQQNKDIPKNYGTLLDIKRRIRRLPTIDAEPVVHAHWIEDNDCQICSNCGEEHSWDEYRASYCEDCGAKMDEEQ